MYHILLFVCTSETREQNIDRHVDRPNETHGQFNLHNYFSYNKESTKRVSCVYFDCKLSTFIIIVIINIFLNYTLARNKKIWTFFLKRSHTVTSQLAAFLADFLLKDDLHFRYSSTVTTGYFPGRFSETHVGSGSSR